MIQPNGDVLELLSTSLPYSETETIHEQRYFSTDNMMKKNLNLQLERFDLSKEVTEIVFSQENDSQVQKGNYVFMINTYGVSQSAEILESKMILGGKAFGIMGTDELRRDLAIGLLWGMPLALLIGISVAIGSVVVGLIYGVYSGYKGKKTDEIICLLYTSPSPRDRG